MRAMDLVRIVLGVVVIWLASAGALAWEVWEIHAWWSFVPAMGYGSAVAVTLPAVVVAVMVGFFQELLKD